MYQFDFPTIPACILETDETGQLSKYVLILHKLLLKEELNKIEIEHIKEVIKFFKTCFQYFQSIPLRELTHEDITNLEKFCHNVLNHHILIENRIDFTYLFRVTLVRDEFIEKGKVRNPAYLTFPKIEVVKANNRYNRANSPNETVFYASFHENVALHEIKPKKYDRIIICRWKNFTGKTFFSYPITSSKPIKNTTLTRTSQVLTKFKERNNPLLSEIAEAYILFLGNEFVKKDDSFSNEKYEYFFSAYFGDTILNPKYSDSKGPLKPINPPDGTKIEKTDCIIYPSVGFHHKEENLAINTKAVLENLKPEYVEDCIVEDTFYDLLLSTEQSPIRKKILRTSTWITENDIIWSDD